MFFSNTFILKGQSLDSVVVNDFYTMTLEELLNVTVNSASKIEQNQREAPNVIEVIGKQEIDDYEWLSINEILYSQPGFAPAQDYDRRTLGFRGMTEGWNNNHVVMLIDGIPFNDNLYGSAFTWEITPLVFTESLEVIRGPGGALYGTNALNGVITVNSIKASDIKKNGKFSSRFGNKNTQIYDIVVGAENDKIGVVSSFSIYSTNGLDFKSYDANMDEKYSVRDNRKSNYFFTNIYGKDAYDGFSLQYHEQSWEYGTGHGWLWYIPDFSESLKEYRRIIALKYCPRNDDRAMNFEISTRYQKHGIDWNLKYYPNDAFDGYYPTGTTEYLKTDAEDWFFRIQSDYVLKKNIFLGGIEFDRFFYNGDDSHYSNTDLNDEGGFEYDSQIIGSGEGWWAPFPNNENREMGSWFESVYNKPVSSGGVFLQYISPKFMQKLQITLSGRYDRQWFKYYQVQIEDKPEISKSFGQLTPRGAITFRATKKLGFKFIAGKAFRYPTPTEMFGNNTWTLASNIDILEPEVVTNFDFVANYKLNDNFNFKLNGFMFNFENIIAYSVQNANLSTNIYTIKNAGIEAAIDYSFGKLSGFANFTYSMRLDEEIKDSNIIENTNEVTWAPPITANFGTSYSHRNFKVSLQVHYQDKVLRRISDKPSELSDYRSTNVNPWININFNFTYNISTYAKVGFNIKNLLDQEQYLLKNNAYPFDYLREGRRLYLQLTFDF